MPVSTVALPFSHARCVKSPLCLFCGESSIRILPSVPVTPFSIPHPFPELCLSSFASPLFSTWDNVVLYSSSFYTAL